MIRPLVCLLLFSLPAAAASPALTGLYAVGELGIVEFTFSDGKAIGRLKAGHQCSNLSADETVVSGSFEGDVFVGVVTICQEGAGCESKRTYPVLGIHRDGEVSAFVHLDPGCSSAALDNQGIVLKPASVEEKQRIVGSGGSASAVAQRNGGKSTEQAKTLTREGTALLNDKKYSLARSKFQQAIALDDQIWLAHFGLGVTLIELGEPGSALPSLDRASSLSAGAPADAVAQIHYNRACALSLNGMKKESVAALRQAVKIGGAKFMADARTDPNLRSVRDEADFRRLNSENLDFRKKPR